ARVWQDGRPPARIGTSLLRLASWRAGRSGLDGPLLHPETMRQTSAEDAVEALYLHERGNGARTQRRLQADGRELASVVTRCAEMTIKP
ncbi:carboxylate--amine ligase, partial [Streptomyces virginiae]